MTSCSYTMQDDLPCRTFAEADRTFTQAQWDKLVEETIANIHSLATIKGGEYSGDEDRLANFRRNALDCGIRMETCWRVYAGKHWDSISTYIRDLQEGRTRPRSESILGRADDLIVYLLLFKAMVVEHTHKGEDENG